jgi:hypothetical protein
VNFDIRKLWFIPFKKTQFNTVISISHDRIRRIGLRTRNERVGFFHSTDTALTNLISGNPPFDYVQLMDFLLRGMTASIN